MKYCILGIHPTSDSYSIIRYFEFYRSRLPALLDDNLTALTPAKGRYSESNLWTPPNRPATLWQTYGEWPLTLAQLHSDIYHIVDQGLFWYSRFLRKG